MKAKQLIALITPPILLAFMYPVFRLLAGALELERLAWYLGLIIYWLIWGAAFPLLLLGRENIRALIRPQRPEKKVLLLVAIPLLLALVGRLIPGMGYHKESVWTFLLLLSTTLGNGFFEEVLWRGVYLKLFPDSIFYRMIWPSLWFALWHYAPGSVLGEELAGLMLGAGLFGLYLSYLAKKTNALWWPMMAHFLSGIIMII